VEGGEPLIAADGLLELNLGKWRRRAFAAVVRIRIHWIHMFFGPPGSFYQQAKIVRKTLIPTVL
jgi:hypothetical protein